MISVYYQDKEIIFDNNCKDYKQSQVIDYDTDKQTISATNLIKKLDKTDKLIIVCKDLDQCYKLFLEQFEQIAAAGGIVQNEENKCLMIFRNNRWDIPKGKQEPNENIEDCAVREVMEECGIEDIKQGDLITKTTHIYFLFGKWHIKTTWWYAMTSTYSNKLTPQTEEGISEVRWVKKSELQELVADSYATIKKVIENYTKQK